MTNFKAAPVPRDALEYFRDRDLRVGFDYRDVWGQEHAHAFTVAKAMKLDVLDDIRAGLDRALADGRTFRDFARDIKPTLQAKGWWGIKEEIDPSTGELRRVQLGSPRRLQVIYESNLRSARAAGQWQRAQRTKDTQPYFLYELGPSERHRPEHVSWAGTLLPVDHPWWQTHMTPNGYGCKCRVRQVSRVEADRLEREGVQDPQAALETDPDTGLPTGRRTRQRMPVRREPPPLRPTTYTNRRTGEQITVDQGLHPAWANNPGQDRAQVLRDRMTGKLDTVDQRLAQATVRDVMNSPILDAWLLEPAGDLPAGVIGSQAQALLGVETQLVRLSPDRFSGTGLAVDDIRALPQLIARGAVIEQGGDLVVFLNRSPGGEPGWWKAVVTAPDNTGRLYVTQYEAATEQELLRAQAQGDVIRSAEE